MKRTGSAIALAFFLAACDNGAEPLAPTVREPMLPAGPLLGVANGPAQYDAVAAKVVVDDLMSRVLPTLTSGAAHEALASDLEALATALIEPDLATLRDHVDAARESLGAYGKVAPSAEEPELGGVDFSLDIVSEGLPPPTGRGRGKKGTSNG